MKLSEVSFITGPVKFLFLMTFFVIVTIGSASTTPDLNQTTTTQAAGPDYEIVTVTLPVQTSWIEPGTSIHPNISIRNNGSADDSTEQVQIKAMLGDYLLISKNSQISPLKGGEERMINPDYLVPTGVPTGEYDLTVSIPVIHNSGTNDGSGNQISASEPVNIKLITSKAKVNSCGCSKPNS
ncbi:MAG: hypothetical protein LUQ50_15800 [Methanospirillum sp.]|uniref:hypothetical protein n=1 Tax=Methanospirillum sp. TaxID=45200 RepID=UPI002369FE88|nr:hypothetical protein [Methanospirillum sp.]MDD1730519.1 hypothetical protein [Methanospirillum sp.]